MNAQVQNLKNAPAPNNNTNNRVPAPKSTLLTRDISQPYVNHANSTNANVPNGILRAKTEAFTNHTNTLAGGLSGRRANSNPRRDMSSSNVLKHLPKLVEEK